MSTCEYYNPISALLPATAIIREFIVDLVLTINYITVAVLGVNDYEKTNRIKLNYSKFQLSKISICSTVSCPLKIPFLSKDLVMQSKSLPPSHK